MKLSEGKSTVKLNKLVSSGEVTITPPITTDFEVDFNLMSFQ
jgi:hypothetical protein